MEISTLFPQVVFHEKMENFSSVKEDLIASIYKLKDNDFGRQASNNGGGWQSNENPTEFRDFIQNLVDSMQIFVTCELCNFWVNVNPPGGYNKQHVHPEAHLSGVFWVKTPPNSGVLTFPNPFAYTQSNFILKFPKEFRDKHKIYTTVDYSPQPGEIIVFPSDLYHGVDPNMSMEDRISIAFNLRTI